MRLELTGRHFTITPVVRAAVERRIAPVLRRLNDSAVSAQVVLTTQKTKVHAEITLHTRGVHFLHGEGLGRDVTGAIGAAADKIERQAETLKGKWQVRKGGRRRTAAVPPAAPAAPPASKQRPKGTPVRGPRVIRARRAAVKPMSLDDAVAQLATSDDALVLFRNSGSDSVTILFRRPDGNLGLIEPEL
jgi:putative sigma-54 modulation protein